MGTYSPAHWLSTEDEKSIEQTILKPLCQCLQTEKLDYRGVIFIGLMKTSTGLKVLEFNVRFGDPETQSLMPRIESDLFDYLKRHR